MLPDFEGRIEKITGRLEDLAAEFFAACQEEANAKADYEQAFLRAYTASGERSVGAREMEAKALTVDLRRVLLLAEARVKALKSEQSALEAVLSAAQTLARATYRIGG